MLGAILCALGRSPTLAAAIGVIVEAESGTLANAMRVYASPLASGGACIQTISAVRQDTPSPSAPPDARYGFVIPTTGSYKVYLRTFAPNSASDSYHFRWDGANYESRSATVSPSWAWQETSAKTLSAGSHTLDLCYRESGFCIDLIVVAPDLTATEKAAIDAAIVSTGRHRNTSTAATFAAVDGSALLEAEEATAPAALFGPATDATASAGSVLTALVNQATAPDRAAAGLEFNVRPDRAGKYDVWIRYSATSAQNRLYLAVDDGDYTAITLAATSGSPPAYAWQRLRSITTQFFAGESYNFRIHPARPGLRLDQVVVTSYPLFNPTGAVTKLDDLAFRQTLPDGAYPPPALTPPADHPRLCFQASDLALIKARMAKPQNATALAAYQRLLATSTDGVLSPVVLEGSMNYSTDTLAAIEAFAFKYALDGEATVGRRAITAIKNFLRTLELDDNIQDVTRQMGHVIFVAAEVYDWCHPLLTPADKNTLIVACEAMAKRMEVGWPPNRQGAITGHAGEAQLLRDLLGFGIATYGERPDIYRYVAGRLLAEFIEPRDFWYRSHTHHQGDSYGNYRFVWEMVFQSILQRMAGRAVFSAEGEFVPYQWIYARRPDGQMMRDGDSYQETSATLGSYWRGDLTPTFYAANFYGNRFIKAQYLATDPTLAGSTSFGLLAPVPFLIFNDPELPGENHAPSFPLTKYFGPPHGMMIARTGWLGPGEVQFASRIAMAQMTIGEQWAANHQHLDAGSFQLYYKGALASESGVYDSYGTPHDRNYHKETIAHNALLIYDPAEVPLQAVNSGGQRRPGGEMSTLAAWMRGGYDRGKVLDQAFDPAGRVPQYSYIKGDLTRAYTNKVSQVLRSMLFLPLDDAQHPAALVVMDKVTAANPAFKKTWLLHTQQEPALAGSTAIVRRDTGGYDGRLDLVSLLPRGAVLTKVGGPGNEFNVGGVQYPPLTYGASACEYGAWRLEISPASATQATDYFLHVLQVSDASAQAAPLEATLIETDDLAGVKLGNRVVVFAKSAERLRGPLAFHIPGGETSGLKVLVAGVQEGRWRLHQGATPAAEKSATAAGGMIFLESGRAGEFRMELATGGPAVAAPPASRLVNISILAPLTTAGDTLTLGFVTGGTGTTGTIPLLVRAAGPSLAALAVPNTLADPRIELFTGATKTGENDNWGGAASLVSAVATVGAFAYSGSGSRDAAALVAAERGDHSVRVSAVDGGRGTVIAEIYDTTPASARVDPAPRLLNASVLNQIGAGFTVGFVLAGTGGKNVLVRAIGPTLGTAFGVSGAVDDPQLTLHAGPRALATNDNWNGDTSLAAAFASVGAFALPASSRDAAVLARLEPGSYTAQVSGAGGTSGLVLVEIYELP